MSFTLCTHPVLSSLSSIRMYSFLNVDAVISDIILNVQRFYEHGGEMQVAQNAPLRPSMDVFSAGYSQLIQLLPAQIHCGIHLWDTRENSNAWNTKVIPEEGYARSLIASPCGNWFVSGSSRGVLTLWDLRFGIPVNSWQYSVACPIEKMCIYVPPQNNSLSNTIRPLVYVAAGCNEVSLWNAENGSCHQFILTD